MADARIIKKYPNRRLYDTTLSRYITLAHIKDLVMNRTEFQVIDAHSGDDLTRGILLQIILEQEGSGEPLFSTEALTHLIRFYGDTVQGLFSAYLEQSVALFIDQQKQLQEKVQTPMAVNPVAVMAELTQRNFDLWKGIQDSFLRAAGLATHTASRETPAASAAGTDAPGPKGTQPAEGEAPGGASTAADGASDGQPGEEDRSGSS